MQSWKCGSKFIDYGAVSFENESMRRWYEFSSIVGECLKLNDKYRHHKRNPWVDQIRDVCLLLTVDDHPLQKPNKSSCVGENLEFRSPGQSRVEIVANWSELNDVWT
jgi:hypothetical protein